MAAMPQFTCEPILQGETFEFRTPVVVEGPVEAWMTSVEQEMRTTLHRSDNLSVHALQHGSTLAMKLHAVTATLPWQCFLTSAAQKLV